MTRRERLLIAVGIVTIPAALLWGEYQLRRGAELAERNCNATYRVAMEEINTCTTTREKCKSYKSYLGRYRSLRRWYLRESKRRSR